MDALGPTKKASIDACSIFGLFPNHQDSFSIVSFDNLAVM